MTVSAGFTVHSDYFNPVGLTLIQLEEKHGLQVPLDFQAADILQKKKVYDTFTEDNMTNGDEQQFEYHKKSELVCKKN